MLYRLYRRDDFAQLYAIELACFESPFRFTPRTMRRFIASPDSATWIAEEAGQLAGFAIVNWAIEAEQIVAYIQTLEVAPSQRKRGIARELLCHMERSAAAAGAQAIWLHVAEANASAIRLYERHGYEFQGREEDFYAQGISARAYARTLVEVL